MKKKILFMVLVLALLAAACMPSQEQINQMVNSAQQTALAQVPTQNVDQIVQATFQALTAQAVASTPIPASSPAALSGSIAGKLSYPSSFIPSLAVVAYVAGGSPTDYYYVLTAENQGTYQLDDLPPGNYYVVAYVIGGGFAGGYSQMVPCGLSAECTDHSLIPVPVTAGQVTTSIDPGDWYAPEDAFPAYPLP